MPKGTHSFDDALQTANGGLKAETAKRFPSSRKARRRTRARWGLLVGAALTVAGGVLVWALIVGPVWSGSVDPASILFDPALGLQRLAAGLLFVGVATLLGSTLAAFLIARARRS
ncbi:MAG: hypothetical protein ACXW3O_03355 [Brevundimonas sp.]